MAAGRLPPAALTLKQTSLSPCQFLRRQQVLQLYRKILRAIREVPAEQDRRYLKDWAREEFKRNKDATEEDAIRMMITQGNMQLQELQRTLKLAKS
ncbi:LYR motif-containing protein 2 isoform X1 [Serinus canaria]|uniref:LYR motif-containing protein 2 isoform X1 n=1 Tax=Serinus canaria TaxID=9135 RepID=UPI0011AE4C56|nr:LYR motif-containing protein 2 isoform X1 [Serinus canaria]